jgi:hypothetical protein
MSDESTTFDDYNATRQGMGEGSYWMRLPPLLRNKFHRRVAVFKPENLLREARRPKRIGKGKVPEICVLDPDGDFVRH